MRLLLVLGLVVLGVVLAPGRAEAGRQWYEAQSHKFSQGDLSSVKNLEDPEFLKEAARDPRGFAFLCETTWFYQQHVSRIHPDELTPALAALVAHADGLRKADEASRHLNVAWAFATIAYCRHRIYAGFKGAQPAWAEAADVLLSKPETIARLYQVAAQALLEATVCKGADVDALTIRSHAALNKALGLIEEPDMSAATRAGWHADAARAEVARKKKSLAKKSVARGLEALAPYMDESEHPGDMATARAELVLLDHRFKLRVKGAKFRWISRRSKTAGLLVEIPVTDVWMFNELKEDQLLSFTQLTPSRCPLRHFVVSAWNPGATVSMPDGTSVSTSDTKNFAAASAPFFPEVLRFSAVERQTKPKKARLHKSLSDVYRSEIEGVGHDGNWARVRVYYFKSKATKRTYRLYYYEHEKDPIQDGLLDLVLSKVRVAEQGR